MSHTLTTCTFCGVGCGIYLETRHGEIAGAYPSASHPANQGRICVRGWHVHEVASSPERLKQPLLRKNGRFEPVSWETAFAFIAEKLKAIRAKYGPDSIGFLNSPRCSNEEAYLLQKIARALIGTNNVDHGTGVYTNNSVEVLLDMLGVPATTCSLADLAHQDVIIVDAVDLGQQLPTVGGWVIRAKLNGAKLIVIDPRRHRVAEHADNFLQINPGSSELLHGAMCKVIVDRGLMNLPFIRAHCRDYEAFLARVENFDVLYAADACGVPPAQIEDAAIAYAQAKSAAILFSSGAESRTVESLESLVNLALLTGKVGRDRSGIYALTEQNNLQGVCDVGMLPNRLPGYAHVTDAAARARLEALWRTPVPPRPGLAARQMLDTSASGENAGLKALWISRYDPLTTAYFSDANAPFKQLELIVMQHLFMVETAKHADVILPTAAFGEERVTFTNTERRIQLAEQVVEPPQGILPAWQQFVRFANAYGANWKYDSTAEIMDEIGAAVPFYAGASYDNLARDYGRQWPCTKDKPLGTKALFEDGIEGQPFKFAATERKPYGAPTDTKQPFALVFGRSLYYWHTNVLVQHSETLKREYRTLLLDYPQGFVEMNPADAKRLEIRDGGRIKLSAATGSSTATARITNEVKAGMIFVPYFLHEVMAEVLGQVVFEAGTGNRPVYVHAEKA